MRTWISSIALAALSLAALAVAAVPARAAELTFTLDSLIGSGYPTSLAPDPNTCLPPNCVLFTGTLADNDVDPQPDTDPSFLLIGLPYTAASDGTDFGGILSLDNTSPIGILSGDGNPADLLPATTYSGAIFGVDIPVGTPVGVYQDTVYLDITPTNGNPAFTVSEQVTVYVTPEPAASGLLFAGLAMLAAWCGVKRKWPALDTSR